MDPNKLDKALKGFLDKTRKQAMGDAQPEMERTITQNVMKIFEPVVAQLSEHAKITKEDLTSALSGLKIPPSQVNIPEIKLPQINVPAPQVKVNYTPPAINIPKNDIKMPEIMKILGEVTLPYDRKNPLSVLMVDPAGNPMMFPISSSGGGGGRSDFFTIKDIQTSAGFSIIDQDTGAMKVSGSFSVTASNSSTQAIDSSGNPYSQANPFPVVFGSSGTTGTNIIDSSGVAYSGSNPVPVVFGASATQAVNLVDSSGIGYSGSNPVPITGPVVVSSVTNSLGATILNGEGVARDTWGASQVGTWNVATLTGVTNSLQSSLIDSSGVQYSGSNPVPVSVQRALESLGLDVMTVRQVSGASDSVVVQSGTITTVTGITNSLQASIIDSSGVQYSGSNPIPITIVSGANDTIAALPYEAMTANRTSKTDGADVRPKADKQGRTLTRPIVARDLISTAYVAVTNGTEATLLAGTAGVYNDLIYILASNNSTVAVGVDIRAVTGGNILMHLEIPANATTGVAPPVPIYGALSDQSGNNWTVDLPDITGTTVSVSALFSKEV